MEFVHDESGSVTVVPETPVESEAIVRSLQALSRAGRYDFLSTVPFSEQLRARRVRRSGDHLAQLATGASLQLGEEASIAEHLESRTSSYWLEQSHPLGPDYIPTLRTLADTANLLSPSE